MAESKTVDVVEFEDETGEGKRPDYEGSFNNAQYNEDGTVTIEVFNPPRSTHPAQLLEVNGGATRPAKVKRLWNGEEHVYDCLVTESIIDQYTQGDIEVGDWLLIEFLHEDEDTGAGEQIAVSKVRKTW